MLGNEGVTVNSYYTGYNSSLYKYDSLWNLIEKTNLPRFEDHRGYTDFYLTQDNRLFLMSQGDAPIIKGLKNKRGFYLMEYVKDYDSPKLFFENDYPLGFVKDSRSNIYFKLVRRGKKISQIGSGIMRKKIII